MSSIQCYDTFGKVKEHLAVKTCAIYLKDSLRESLAMELLSSSQGNHSPGTVKFPDISIHFMTLRGTHIHDALRTSSIYF